MRCACLASQRRVYRRRLPLSPFLVPRPVPNFLQEQRSSLLSFFLSQSGYCFTAGRYLSRQPDHSFERILRTPLVCHNEVLYDPCCCVRGCGPYVCICGPPASPDSYPSCVFPVGCCLLYVAHSYRVSCPPNDLSQSSPTSHLGTMLSAPRLATMDNS